MKVYIGIDPGSKGFLTALSEEGHIIDRIGIVDHSEKEIAEWLNGMQLQHDVFAVMEEVHAIFGSSAKATFAFGEIFGMLKGMLISFSIPYALVPPKKWQTEIWTASDKVTEKSKVNTKLTSINAARRLYPTESFLRSASCRNIDDNLVDSTLIATYAKRKNL